MTPSEAIYQAAVEAQLAGRTDEATKIYRKLLDEKPDHPEGNHNLGLLMFQGGQLDQALECLMNAVEARPAEAHFWMSLVEVLIAARAFDHARNAVEQARLSGIAAPELTQMEQRISSSEFPPVKDVQPVQISIDGEREEILAAVGRILERGQIQRASGKRAEIRGRIPDRKQINRMIALFNAGELDELEKVALKLTRSHPLYPGGWHFLGMARMRLGERLESLRALIKANELFSGDAQMLDHLGTALTSFNYPVEAAALFELSLQIRPNRIDTLVRYANLQVNQLDFRRAEELARRALGVAADSAMANRMMAVVLLSTRRAVEALPFLEKAIDADPHMGEAYQDLGYTYFSMGRLQDAIKTSALAVERNPDNAPAFSNLLFFMTHDHRLTPEDIFSKHLEFGRHFETPLLGNRRRHENDRNPERRLRVGIVSADLYNHAVAHFISPVLSNIDREQFDLFAFHNTQKFDDTSRQLKQKFKYWLSVPQVSDKDLAEIIRACRIDILIDLSGHTAGHRLLTFARKPAPVQVTWIGYPNTTGLSSIDYAFGDRHNAPAGLYDHLYTEKIVRLPSDSPFKFPDHAPDVGPLPALRNGYLTFGSFNRLGKISPVALDMWARAMHACDGSRLLIGSVGSSEAEEKMVAEFAARGISSERLRFEPRKPANEYLALHNDIDIILDTFPYNGGTTSGLALWMGVPVLTMAGRSRMSNAGAGGMRRFGLEHFVATDPEDFVQKAQQLSISLEELAGVRQGLRKRLIEAPDRSDAFITKGFERALRMMWQRWCSGLPAEAFFVDS